MFLPYLGSMLLLCLVQSGWQTQHHVFFAVATKIVTPWLYGETRDPCSAPVLTHTALWCLCIEGEFMASKGSLKVSRALG